MSKPENQRFPVRKLATSHCTDCRKQKRVGSKYFIKSYEKAYPDRPQSRSGIGHTRKSVQSPLVVLKEK